MPNKIKILLLLIILSGLYYFNQLSKRNDKAVSLVKDIPEVQEWLNLFTGPDGTSASTDGRPIIEVDGVDGNIYTVHAYEWVSDHTATFNWYYVDLETGEVKDFFDK
ncbi:MAG: hypothetical protein UX85_C0005G0052 [Candidatus Beckwithbacteria bacterium GW2011_GWB1_47_15]|uniref:PepSY domain-containing protein n=1 Tax=Candidatus Beckwithbacteria bacterium GW2011_GWB1_47_15 TaxID=1618371 RepID=A0A0G1RUL5_9BACT|nr:MAG: hypothetical protein UY43_C0001G0782 [Candidatus Beckwithbacteria bacterium GW2011_GWC1_49_16]KKU35760.1 MAG: hypothetical protein UX50_C0002G0187 [Candidatus Beckwithbacteria bacterium GW2011_GWA1_46_30]KKU61014.1 MAG: hypothetical protein UX85_C0005G0052 [Candidatus Beckwithbacteria bacterium GW2011_GWB1_47_15]KKU72319.1 MAG: hypothetical protein UX97_C0001G0189 [Candidatus Beckwithbacteria bacterium GW2011_GWA2_47_25]KKW04921.1 MAG: hypothetical protein UY37_C0001G0025 [Candidatus Be